MYPNNFQRQYSRADLGPAETDGRVRSLTAPSNTHQISRAAGTHQGFTHFSPVYPRESDEQRLRHNPPYVPNDHNNYHDQSFFRAPHWQPSSAAVDSTQTSLLQEALQIRSHRSESVGTPLHQSLTADAISVHSQVSTQFPVERTVGSSFSYQPPQTLIADPAAHFIFGSDQYHSFGFPASTSQFLTSATSNNTVLIHGGTSSSPLPSQTPAGVSSSFTNANTDKAEIEYAQRHYRGKPCFYQCRFDLNGSPCNKWVIGDRVRVAQHLRQHHRIQTDSTGHASCLWDNCTHSKPIKRENLARHVVMHLGVKWKCGHCSEMFSRDDAVQRHIERVLRGMGDVPEAEVIPGREARAPDEPQIKKPRTA
jgi:hypothetical protein